MIILFSALILLLASNEYKSCPECEECINYKKAYNENCATLSQKLAKKLTDEGYNVSVVHGKVVHSWVVCYNCSHYVMWYDYNGEIIYEKEMYTLNG